MALVRQLKIYACCVLTATVFWPLSAVAETLGDGMAAYDQGDYVEALAIWRPLAEQDDAVAQSLIAMIYELGEGVPRQPKLAARWYERAAKAGHPPSQFQLGRLFRDGVGVKRDVVESFVWFSLAAESIPKDAAGSNAATRILADLTNELNAEDLKAASDRLNNIRLNSPQR